MKVVVYEVSTGNALEVEGVDARELVGGGLYSTTLTAEKVADKKEPVEVPVSKGKKK